MRLVAGVDGGQSSTVAALADLDRPGAAFARGAGPPADLVGELAGSVRQRDAIVAAVRDVFARNGLVEATPLAALVAGLSGHEDGEDLALPFEGTSIRAVHDSVAAHAGALGGAPGIVTIAGTGSVVLGTDGRGARARAGGWGYLFGDGGSAFALGRGAISSAMQRADRGEATALESLVLEHFRVRDLRAVQTAVAAGTIGRPAIAALAEGLFELARTGDAGAARLVRSGAEALAASVRAVNGRLPREALRDVSYAGGLFRDAAYLALFTKLVEASAPLAGASPDGSPPRAAKPAAAPTPLFVRPPLGDGAAGALALARDLVPGAAPSPHASVAGEAGPA